MTGRLTRPTALAGLFITTVVAPGSSVAQSGYYNSEAAHPIRVEDASPTERFSLDLHLPSARFERLDAGARRWRFEPSVSYGVLPRTAVEIRTSFVYREATATPRGGLSGIGMGVLHALNTETASAPAIAFGGEVYKPAGSAGSGGIALALRALLTRTTPLARLHFNASYGSYNVSVVRATNTCTKIDILLGSTCGGSAPPVVPEGPCALQESDLADNVLVPNARDTRAPDVPVRPAVFPGLPPPALIPLRGRHWLAGVSADRALPLRSMLLMADVFVERYSDLFDKPDWTAEAGVRQQLTPQLTLEAAIGRRFAGVTRSWIITFGASRSTPIRP